MRFTAAPRSRRNAAVSPNSSPFGSSTTMDSSDIPSTQIMLSITRWVLPVRVGASTSMCASSTAM